MRSNTTCWVRCPKDRLTAAVFLLLAIVVSTLKPVAADTWELLVVVNFIDPDHYKGINLFVTIKGTKAASDELDVGAGFTRLEKRRITYDTDRDFGQVKDITIRINEDRGISLVDSVTIDNTDKQGEVYTAEFDSEEQLTLTRPVIAGLLGCFKRLSSNDPLHVDTQRFTTDNTPAKCIAHCKNSTEKGHKLASVWGETNCSCGETYNKDKRDRMHDCGILGGNCPGNKDLKCGTKDYGLVYYSKSVDPDAEESDEVEEEDGTLSITIIGLIIVGVVAALLFMAAAIYGVFYYLGKQKTARGQRGEGGGEAPGVAGPEMKKKIEDWQHRDQQQQQQRRPSTSSRGSNRRSSRASSSSTGRSSNSSKGNRGSRVSRSSSQRRHGGSSVETRGTY